jgi:lipopolysaccharide/colanic/teichoic acid biosynthesis glycosyltransferase
MRAIVRLVSPEMAAMGAIEMLLTTLLVAGLLEYPLVSRPGIPAVAASGDFPFSITLSLVIVAVGWIVGLYRRRVCLDRRRVLIGVPVAAFLTIPAALGFAPVFGIHFTGELVFAMVSAWMSLALLIRTGFAFFSMHRSAAWRPNGTGASRETVRDGRIDVFSAETAGSFPAGRRDESWASRIARRAMDIVVSLALIVATVPLLLVVAVLIPLDSPGPVLYRQERTGLRGKPFRLLKFRSMSVNAEPDGIAVWARRNDPRMTRLGAIIRAARIDELPQLFNVLRGEMSMIGPRPERPMFVDELSRIIPLYDRRHDVRPGLTGWAQVNYPYGASVSDAREKLAYDLWYVSNRNMLLDLLILVLTVRVVLFCEGSR